MTTATADIADPCAGALEEGAGWELASLRRVGELCLELTELAAARARDALAGAPADAGDEAPRAGPDPVRAFAQLTRAVRMTVGLHARIRRERELRKERRDAEQGARDAEARAELEDRRRTGNLRRAMTQFIARTAIEAGEREDDEVDRLMAEADARLCEGRADPIDFERVEVKPLAYSICQSIGVDPGPDWWREGWMIDTDAREFRQLRAQGPPS
jgi:hypothetical protein